MFQRKESGRLSQGTVIKVKPDVRPHVFDPFLRTLVNANAVGDYGEVVGYSPDLMFPYKVRMFREDITLQFKHEEIEIISDSYDV